MKKMLLLTVIIATAFLLQGCPPPAGPIPVTVYIINTTGPGEINQVIFTRNSDLAATTQNCSIPVATTGINVHVTIPSAAAYKIDITTLNGYTATWNDVTMHSGQTLDVIINGTATADGFPRNSATGSW